MCKSLQACTSSSSYSFCFQFFASKTQVFNHVPGVQFFPSLSEEPSSVSPSSVLPSISSSSWWRKRRNRSVRSAPAEGLAGLSGTGHPGTLREQRSGGGFGGGRVGWGSWLGRSDAAFIETNHQNYVTFSLRFVFLINIS